MGLIASRIPLLLTSFLPACQAIGRARRLPRKGLFGWLCTFGRIRTANNSSDLRRSSTATLEAFSSIRLRSTSRTCISKYTLFQAPTMASSMRKGRPSRAIGNNLARPRHSCSSASKSETPGIVRREGRRFDVIPQYFDRGSAGRNQPVRAMPENSLSIDPVYLLSEISADEPRRYSLVIGFGRGGANSNSRYKSFLTFLLYQSLARNAGFRPSKNAIKNLPDFSHRR